MGGCVDEARPDEVRNNEACGVRNLKANCQKHWHIRSAEETFRQSEEQRKGIEGDKGKDESSRHQAAQLSQRIRSQES